MAHISTFNEFLNEGTLNEGAMMDKIKPKISSIKKQLREGYNKLSGGQKTELVNEFSEYKGLSFKEILSKVKGKWERFQKEQPIREYWEPKTSSHGMPATSGRAAERRKSANKSKYGFFDYIGMTAAGSVLTGIISSAFGGPNWLGGGAFGVFLVCIVIYLFVGMLFKND